VSENTLVAWLLWVGASKDHIQRLANMVVVIAVFVSNSDVR
jgi:hypothetical protein